MARNDREYHTDNFARTAQVNFIIWAYFETLFSDWYPNYTTSRGPLNLTPPLFASTQLLAPLHSTQFTSTQLHSLHPNLTSALFALPLTNTLLHYTQSNSLPLNFTHFTSPSHHLVCFFCCVDTTWCGHDMVCFRFMYCFVLWCGRHGVCFYALVSFLFV